MAMETAMPVVIVMVIAMTNRRMWMTMAIVMVSTVELRLLMYLRIHCVQRLQRGVEAV